MAPFGVKALIAERKEKTGEDLKEKLGYMIQASSRVVALLTLKATQSEMVKWEMKKAHQEFGVKIMPFVENEGCTLRVGLPKTLEWHQLDKNDLSHIGKTYTISVLKKQDLKLVFSHLRAIDRFAHRGEDLSVAAKAVNENVRAIATAVSERNGLLVICGDHETHVKERQASQEKATVPLIVCCP